ncbi:hypothetical protein [Nocardioides sp.]|uniref:hypothetical protein n=1 Tax=Nocardioides sp. TaxID=35761 RepID=UPI002B269F5E|nr:hypothetical protein [Nocardioides sp.]
MENINTTATTIARPGTTSGSTSAFAMSTRGCTFAALDADRTAGQRWIPAIGLTTDPSATIRERQVTAKGHVGLVAYTPGNHAWKPPLC